MLFSQSECPLDKKLDNFTKYVRRQKIGRFLAQYEIFRRQVGIKGSIVECGVHHGGGLMAWAKLSAIFEPYNYHRKVIGFDTFCGFPSISEIDKEKREIKEGAFGEEYDVYDELSMVVREFDDNRFINHIEKVELVKGDANITIPQYINENKHIIVSLLFLDFDLYQPSITALEHFLPRMAKGAICAFDELNNELWPGETIAFMENFNLSHHKLECFDFEPNISFIQL